MTVGTYQTEDFATVTVGQLKQLLDGVDDDKEVRIWCEEKNDDGVIYLSGRRLIGVTDEEDRCCLCAAFYEVKE